MPQNSILSPFSMTSWFDAGGGTAIAADLYFYSPGTLAPLLVYQDALLSIPHSQPVETTGNFRCPPVFVGENSYRVRVLDLTGALLEDIDGLPGADPDPATVPDPIGTDPQALYQTGDYIISGGSGAPRAGAVRANGFSIGSAPSGATERANADTQALFLHLWGQDTAGRLAVLPSRGGTAAADWAANKTLALPDYRGRSVFGVDGMGNAATGRMTGGTFALGVATEPFAHGGAAAHTLTTAQLAVHGHAVNDPGHTHSFTTDAPSSDIFIVRMTSGGVYDINSGGPSNGYGQGGGIVGGNSAGITLQNTGSGASHPQLPPFMTGAVYIKL